MDELIAQPIYYGYQLLWMSQQPSLFTTAISCYEWAYSLRLLVVMNELPASPIHYGYQLLWMN